MLVGMSVREFGSERKSWPIKHAEWFEHAWGINRGRQVVVRHIQSSGLWGHRAGWIILGFWVFSAHPRIMKSHYKVEHFCEQRTVPGFPKCEVSVFQGREH